MKKIVMSLLLVSLLAGLSFATELGGKCGFGDRNGSLSMRHFFNNSYAGDVYVDYSNVATAGQSTAYQTGLAVAGFMVREIADKTLLECGATVGGYSGADGTGAAVSGIYVNPFVGGEYLAGDHFGVDFKVILGGVANDLTGATRTIAFTGLATSLGMHLYL